MATVEAAHSLDPPLRVLVVDDHPRVRRGLEMSLQAASDLVVVGSAANGLEAVAMCEQLSPDVVVMDLAMPVLDGVEATRRMLECSNRPAIVAVSGSRQLMGEALAAGAAATILKDADPAELLTAIRTAARHQ